MKSKNRMKNEQMITDKNRLNKMKENMERKDNMSENWNNVEADYTVTFCRTGYSPDDGRPCDYFRGEDGQSIRVQHGEESKSIRTQHGEDCQFIRMQHGDDECIAEWKRVELSWEDGHHYLYAPGEHTTIRIADDEHGVQAIERIGDSPLPDGTDCTARKKAPYYYKGEVEGVRKVDDYKALIEDMLASYPFAGMDKKIAALLSPGYLFNHLNRVLKDREISIIVMSYPYGEERVASNVVAKALGLSEERITQLKEKIFAKLGEVLEMECGGKN